VVSYTKEYVESLIAPTEPMTDEEIADVIAAFVRGAVAAKEVGFDGVALHGAHGYLIDSFFWHDTNRRDDRYGGPIRSRVRFGEEIVKATRAAVGPEFPIMFRYSQHKQQDYKARLASSPEELEMFLGPLAAAGVDLFDASARRFYERAFATSPLTLAGWTKKLTGVPSVAVGSAGLTAEGTPEHMAAFLDREEFDFIAIGRAVLHDPNWARKVQVGETPDAFDPSSLEILT
jgi:2,4-dienoyl-CoA reductase-like NADH-dependent reductase (Old Yellow Enzyme family)